MDSSYTTSYRLPIVPFALGRTVYPQYRLHTSQTDRRRRQTDATLWHKRAIPLIKINAKKHSLAHQLTAQLHIENSKNKKNGDNTIAAYRLNVDCCKRFITISFIFAVFDV